MNCDNNCSTCGTPCGESTQKEQQVMKKLKNPYSKITKVYAVMSGKGGVGKSLVTSMMAVTMRRRGYKVGILDADITGPSIPKIFNLNTKAMGSPNGIIPVETKTGIKIMSTNLILDQATDPVVWRGPILGGVVKQFWSEVNWGDLDYLFIDMPPGTGDVPITVYQSLPVDGIIVVTTPQELVSMIVEKAVNMASLLSIPIVALVENMSYFVCSNCDKKHYIFGKSTIEQEAQKYNIKNLATLPINPELAHQCDLGQFEVSEFSYLDSLGSILEGK